MKTSLNIDDHLFQLAKKEALKSRKSLSEIISYWARAGREFLVQHKKQKPIPFKPLDLGGPALIDINSRNEWMDLIDK
ncbi:MAG: hypothetical protein HQM16_13940 [Deltaproteobacteria bacterium]|nr:hypothetical protein [Deltaproteobacteria bacterium]